MSLIKVVVVLHRDSENLFIENVVRLLEKRHELKIFAVYPDEQSTRMFAGLETPIIPFGECTDEAIAWADCIFCPIGPVRFFDRTHKYIFQYCNIIPKLEEAKGVDFVFFAGPSKEEPIPYFASMPVGLPKNDSAIVNNAVDPKQFLYIDSGHFPFGRKGKEQIAKMLVDICKAHPDYRVCVKPRWFPGATAEVMTHQNFDHIYPILEDLYPEGLPPNLDLLMEHKDLQTLIDQSSCVLTLATTAHLDVALRGKPLLMLKGFQNESTYAFNDSYFDAFYQAAEESDCVIHFEDVLQHLPQGKMCNPIHIQNTLPYRTGVSERIVEVMAFVVQNYLSQGKFPDLKQYDYEHYQTQMTADAGLTYKDLLVNRLFFLARVWGINHRRLEGDFDWIRLDRKIFKMCQQTVRQAKPVLPLKRRVVHRKAKFILKGFSLLQHEMDRARLYSLLYDCRWAYKLLRIERKQLGFWGNMGFLFSRLSTNANPYLSGFAKRFPNIIAKQKQVDDSLNYFLAIIYFHIKRYNKCLVYLERYFEGLFSRKFPKYREEKSGYLRRAFTMLFRILLSKRLPDNLDWYVRRYLELVAEQYPNLVPNGPKSIGLFERVANALEAAGHSGTARSVRLLLENAEQTAAI